jgi:hypothetical protein
MKCKSRRRALRSCHQRDTFSNLDTRTLAMRLNMPALPCRGANERCLATDEPEHRRSRIAVEGETATLSRVELCNSGGNARPQSRRRPSETHAAGMKWSESGDNPRRLNAAG